MYNSRDFQMRLIHYPSSEICVTSYFSRKKIKHKPYRFFQAKLQEKMFIKKLFETIRVKKSIISFLVYKHTINHIDTQKSRPMWKVFSYLIVWNKVGPWGLSTHLQKCAVGEILISTIHINIQHINSLLVKKSQLYLFQMKYTI